MKATRTAPKKIPASGRKAPATLKPLPVPRLRRISVEKLTEFEARFRPRPGASATDLVAHLIRLRGGAP